jgi:hypothetical protein
MKTLSMSFCATALAITLFGCQRPNQHSSVMVDEGGPSDKEDIAFQCSAEVRGVSYARFGMYKDVQPAKMYLRTNMRQGEAYGPWANPVGKTDHAYGQIVFASGAVELFDSSGVLLGRFKYAGSQSEAEVFFGLDESQDTRMMSVGEGKGEFQDKDGKVLISDLACTTLGGIVLNAPNPAGAGDVPAETGVARSQPEADESGAQPEHKVTTWGSLDTE